MYFFPAERQPDSLARREKKEYPDASDKRFYFCGWSKAQGNQRSTSPGPSPASPRTDTSHTQEEKMGLLLATERPIRQSIMY